MMQDAFQEVRDLPRERPQNVSENDFVVKQKPEDPYGFWWISREKGQVPEKLSGAYTTVGYAELAVKNYVENLKKK